MIKTMNAVTSILSQNELSGRPIAQARDVNSSMAQCESKAKWSAT